MGRFVMLVWLLLSVMTVRAQSDYDCTTAKTLKEFLDDRHIEPESLEGQWSEAVTTIFLLRLDPNGLLFTQEGLAGPLSSFSKLESVIEEDACDLLSDFNSFLTTRLILGALMVIKD